MVRRRHPWVIIKREDVNSSLTSGPGVRCDVPNFQEQSAEQSAIFVRKQLLLIKGRERWTRFANCKGFVDNSLKRMLKHFVKKLDVLKQRRLFC